MTHVGTHPTVSQLSLARLREKHEGRKEMKVKQDRKQGGDMSDQRSKTSFVCVDKYLFA